MDQRIQSAVLQMNALLSRGEVKTPVVVGLSVAETHILFAKMVSAELSLALERINVLTQMIVLKKENVIPVQTTPVSRSTVKAVAIVVTIQNVDTWNAGVVVASKSKVLEEIHVLIMMTVEEIPIQSVSYSNVKHAKVWAEISVQHRRIVYRKKCTRCALTEPAKSVKVVGKTSVSIIPTVRTWSVETTPAF